MTEQPTDSLAYKVGNIPYPAGEPWFTDLEFDDPSADDYKFWSETLPLTEGNGSRKWLITAHAEYGFPRRFERRVWETLIEMTRREGLAGLVFAYADLLDLLGVEQTKARFDQLQVALYRLNGVSVEVETVTMSGSDDEKSTTHSYRLFNGFQVESHGDSSTGSTIDKTGTIHWSATVFDALFN